MLCHPVQPLDGDSLTSVALRCGDNAPRTQGLQKQGCIPTLRKAESKDQMWEGLVSDESHHPVLQSATVPLTSACRGVFLFFVPSLCLVNLSLQLDLPLNAHTVGWASVYDNPRGEGQLSSRDQKQVTEIGDQGPYEASWLLSSCRLQAVIGASSEI